MRFKTYILSFFLTMVALAQSQQVDSLSSVSNAMNDSPEKVNVLLKLADLYNYSGEKDSAEVVIKEAEQVSKRISYLAGQARCLWKLADLALNTDVAQAKDYLHTSLNLSYQSDDDETIVGTLNELGYYYLYYVASQTDSARYFFNKSLELNNDRFPADSKYSFRFLSSFYSSAGDNLVALDYIDRALALDTTNLYAWNRKAALLGSLGRGAEAIEVYLKIIREGEKINNPFVRTFEKNLASAYSNQGNYDKALVYAKSALEKEIAGGDLLSIVYAENQVGSIFISMNQFDSAKLYLRKAIKGIESNDLECLGDPIRSFAYLNTKAENYDSALFYYRKAQTMYESCNNTELVARSKLGVAEVFNLTGEFLKAERELDEVEQLIDLDQFPNIKQSLTYGFYDTYKRQKRFREALEQYEINRIITDSLFSAKNDAEIARLEANHEFEKEKSALIAKQKTEKIEFDYRLKRSQQLVYLVGIGFLIVAIFAYTIYLSYRKIKRARKVIAQKNDELEKTANELRDLSEFKQGMTNMIAHDIKNPLNSIIGLSDKMDKRVGNDVAKAGEAILRLITNMLDVEKFEETNPILNLESVSISELVTEARLAAELLLHDKSVQLQVDLDKDINIEVDRDLIVRVLVNLLSNAIKFSPSNETIRIHSQVINADENNFLKLGVADKGSGIPKEDQPFLFEKFYQSQAKKSGLAPSTGLGLTFCKMAMVAHNGAISVESDEGIGSTFWLTFEIDKPDGLPIETKAYNQKMSISEKDQNVLKNYSTKLKKLKVHNVSAIMAILDEIDELNLDNKWTDQVRSAVQYANGDQYELLITQFE